MRSAKELAKDATVIGGAMALAALSLFTVGTWTAIVVSWIS